MVDTHQKELNQKPLQILWIIWVAMLGTLFIYVLICHLLDAEMRPSMGPNFPLDLIRNILYGVSFFILILTRFIRKRILAGRPEGLGPKPLKSPSLSKQPASLDKYVPAMIVSLALSEFIAIIGPNGAGKTTLLETINGLLPYSSG